MDPADRCLTIGSDVIQSVDVVRDLGVYFDAHLSMKTHVARVARSCFYHLRRLRSIRRNLGRDMTTRLVSAFVISRLDYCNSVLAHLPASTLAPLQRVLNAAARLVMDLKPRVTGSARTALAANFRANKFQTLYFGAPCHQRSSTIVFN